MVKKFLIYALAIALALLLAQGAAPSAAQEKVPASIEPIRITSIEPSSVRPGANAVITGWGFSDNKNDLLVLIGQRSPEVKFADKGLIVVEVPPDIIPGTYPVTVRHLLKNISSEPFQVAVVGAAGEPREAVASEKQVKASPRAEQLTVPAGTPIVVRLMQTISSDESRQGETVSFVLEEALRAGDLVAAEKGSRVIGRITEAEESKRVKGRARLSFILTSLTPRGSDASYPLVTNTFFSEAKGTKGRDTAIIGGGTGLGAALGALTSKKKGKGALIGGLVGGGAGSATILATKGKELEFKPDTVFTFTLEAQITVHRR